MRKYRLPLLAERHLLRRLFLVVSMATGFSASAGVLFGLSCRCLDSPHLVLILSLGGAVWGFGALFLSSPLNWLYLAVPLVLPIAGPLLVSIGTISLLLVRRKDYLAFDPTLNMIFHPSSPSARFSDITLEEILENDRKIVSAGDILRWGDISIKQAVIDRLASGEVSPRAIRILKGAWNDPDEEVRLFATTILTRLEKFYQERIKSLIVDPDPERPHAAVGKLYMAYAQSNLVGQKLARVLVESGLVSYRKALEAGEPISVLELFSVGAAAVALGFEEIESSVVERLEGAGAAPMEVKKLGWMKLYEEGRWNALREEVRRTAILPETGPLPDYMSIWVSDEPVETSR